MASCAGHGNVAIDSFPPLMRMKQIRAHCLASFVGRKPFLLQLVADGPLSKARTDRQIEQGIFSNEITLVSKGYLNACRCDWSNHHAQEASELQHTSPVRPGRYVWFVGEGPRTGS
jgi:hypothetical protein